MTPEEVREISARYQELRPKYVHFAKSMADLLASLLTAKGIDFVQVSARAKVVASFAEKIVRDGKSYQNPLSEVTDLCGARVVSYDETDVRRIGELIRENFDVDENNSIDKATQFDPDRFGYLSVHYVVQIGETRRDLPEYAAFKALRLEVQVRTALQHAWAALDHKLRYKATADVPRELRRRLYRISALLELADDEFRRLTKESEHTRERYTKEVAAGSIEAMAIDADSVDAFLRESDIVAKLQDYAKAAGFVLAPFPPNQKTPWSSLVRSLDATDIDTLGDFKRRLDSVVPTAREVFLSLAKRWSIDDATPPLVVDPNTLVKLAFALSLDVSQAQKVLFGPSLEKIVTDELSE